MIYHVLDESAVCVYSDLYCIVYSLTVTVVYKDIQNVILYIIEQKKAKVFEVKN